MIHLMIGTFCALKGQTNPLNNAVMAYSVYLLLDFGLHDRLLNLTPSASFERQRLGVPG
jgi:hypothetical protein